MAFLNEAFDVNELPQGNTGNFEPLPAGWYNVTVSQAELKDTKSGTGQYIKLRYDVTGPTHQGRVVFGNLNIKNANSKAEEIGRMDLGNIMRAIGLARVTDTDQLIGNSLSIKLDIKTDPQYGASNEVKGYKSLSGSAAPVAQMSQPTVATSTAKAAPPWATKK